MDDRELSIFVRSAFSASFIIAATDGNITDAELTAFKDAIKNRLDIDLEATDVQDVFEDGHQGELDEHLKQVSEARVLPESMRREIFSITATVAAADADLSIPKLMMTPKIAEALSIDYSAQDNESEHDAVTSEHIDEEDPVSNFHAAALSMGVLVATADGEIAADQLWTFGEAWKARLNIEYDVEALRETFDSSKKQDEAWHLEQIRVRMKGVP